MHVMQECHCMLFLTEDNDFRGDDQAITLDEVSKFTTLYWPELMANN